MNDLSQILPELRHKLKDPSTPFQEKADALRALAWVCLYLRPLHAHTNLTFFSYLVGEGTGDEGSSQRQGSGNRYY